MIVLVANDLPDAVRGKLKLWFVEPKPNVFISGIKDALADRIVHLLTQYTPTHSGFLLFRSIPRPPGYQIHVHGFPSKQLTTLTGLQLVLEKSGLPTSDEIMEF